MRSELTLRLRFAICSLVSALVLVSACNRAGEIKGDVFIVTKARDNIKLGLVDVTAISENDMVSYLKRKEAEAKAKETEVRSEHDTLQQEYQQAYDKALKLYRDAEQAYDQIVQKYSSVAYEQQQKLYGEVQRKGEDRDSKKAEADKLQDKLNRVKAAVRSPITVQFYFEGLPVGVARATTDSDGKFSMKLPDRGKFALAAVSSRQLLDSTETYYWLVWVSLDGAESKNIILSNTNLATENSTDSVLLGLPRGF